MAECLDRANDLQLHYKIGLKKLHLQSIWLFSVFCSLSLSLYLCVPLLSVSFLFPSLTPPPRPNASFPYRPLHLSVFFIGRFTDSAGAYSCRRPPNSVAFLNSSRSTDDLRKKSISSVTGINERSVSSSTEYHANSTSTSHNLPDLGSLSQIFCISIEIIYKYQISNTKNY